jgi:hypothetical protein
MSEAKNTALGSFVAFGYSHGTPAENNPPLSTNRHMITATLVLSALVILTSWDGSDAQSRE